MASLAELQDALVNADKAGDADAARQLADAIHSMRKTQEAMPTAAQAGGALNDIPRQIGLTARYGLEGLANAAQVFTEPLRYLQDKITPDRAPTMSQLVTGERTPKSMPLGVVASQFADSIGLPKPQGANERTVAEATRLGFGAGGLAGGASKAAQVAGPIASKTLGFLAANPTQQITAAAGAGAAANASKEAGGGFGQQLGASVVGGVAGGLVPGAAGVVRSGVNAIKNEFGKGMTNPQLDAKISLVLQRTGVDYRMVSEKVKQGMRAEMRSLLEADKELDPAAVRRLLDFKRTGTTPTRGMVSQDPVQITREMNLAKTAANSSDGQLHGLPRLQNQNNARLIENLNESGASRGNVDAAGEFVTSSVLGRQAGLRSAEDAAWERAKGMPGYTQPISSRVISDINEALGSEGMMPFMNPTISRYMEAFQNGQPFTPQAYRNLQSMLAREVSKGGNEGAAAGLARRVLEQSDLQPARFATDGSSVVTQGMANGMQAVDNNATDAIAAVNAARRATRQAYQYEDSSTLVRSVLSDGATSDPQRIAKRFVIGGTVREARDLAQQVGPGGIGEIKNAIVAHLKDKAVNGATDEVGKFSQSAYNKALNAIGDGKLALFFAPDEIEQLRAVGRAASYMQNQPVGSAVNNSNSGAMMVGKAYDALRGGLGMIPGVGPVTAGLLDVTLGNPTKSAYNFIGSRQAQNAAQGLLAGTPAGLRPENLIFPAAAMGGLLTAP